MPSVLQVIASVDPLFGGPSQVCVDLSRALVNIGWRVSIFTTDAGSGRRLAREEIESATAGVDTKAFPFVGSARYSFSPRLFRELNAHVSAFDIVHIHSIYRGHLPAAWIACKRAGVPFIVRPHGALDPFTFARNRWVKAVHEVLFEKRAFRDAAAIQFTAHEEMSRAASTGIFGPDGPRNGVVIPNGVTIPADAHVPRAGTDEPLFLRHPELLGKEIILFLGRIHPKKGLDLLIQAFIPLARKAPNIHLVVAGPDNEGYAAQVMQWLDADGMRDRVTFPGMLKGAVKWSAFRSARVFVLPSYAENFGIAAFEAIGCGCPVVISDQVNTWRELAAEGVAKVVPCDARKLENAVREVLADNLHRELQRSRGPKLIADGYSWERVAAQMVELYDSITAGAGRP